MEPNKERIEMWCQAMESGEYPQGKGRLYDGSCYCPLGIACEVYRKVTGDGKWTHLGLFSVGGRKRRSFLPMPVANWYGINTSPTVLPIIFLFRGVYKEEPIIYINDELDFTLPQIAAAVRRTYGLPTQQ